MNQEELDANPLLTERHVINLNKKPRALEELLPEETVDLINIDLSIDYMTSPGLVTNLIFCELPEVLKRLAGSRDICLPGGQINDPSYGETLFSSFHPSNPLSLT